MTFISIQFNSIVSAYLCILRRYHCLEACCALLAKVDLVLSCINAKLSVKPINLDSIIKVRSCDYVISILDQCQFIRDIIVELGGTRIIISAQRIYYITDSHLITIQCHIH